MIGLGRILSETRESRGVSLEEVERETRISRRYLLALEEEDFAAFPFKGQARGFLGLYAQYLGLDTAEMLALFPDDTVPEAPDGLVHNDRIFREARPQPGPSFPEIRLPRAPMLVAATLIGAVLLAGLVGSVCASGSERTYAAFVERSRTSRLGSFTVPDVRDQTLQGALETFERAGIRPLVIEVPSDRAAAGLVITQSPPAGTVIQSPTDATLIVSRGRP